MYVAFLDSQQERTRRGPGNQIYLVANPATAIHQEHVPRIKIIHLLDNRYDAFDYDNHICEHRRTLITQMRTHCKVMLRTSLPSVVPPRNITAKCCASKKHHCQVLCLQETSLPSVVPPRNITAKCCASKKHHCQVLCLQETSLPSVVPPRNITAKCCASKKHHCQVLCLQETALPSVVPPRNITAKCCASKKHHCQVLCLQETNKAPTTTGPLLSE